MKLDHVLLVTKSFEKLTEWYIKNLGFEITREWMLEDLLPDYRIAYLEKDGLKLEIMGGGAMAKDAVFGNNVIEDTMIPGYRHIGVVVDDVDKVFRELSGKGIETPFSPMDVAPAGIRAFFLQDCDKNIIEFIQPLK